MLDFCCIISFEVMRVEIIAVIMFQKAQDMYFCRCLLVYGLKDQEHSAPKKDVGFFLILPCSMIFFSVTVLGESAVAGLFFLVFKRIKICVHSEIMVTLETIVNLVMENKCFLLLIVLELVFCHRKKFSAAKRSYEANYRRRQRARKIR